MAITPYEEKKYIPSDAVAQAQQALQNQQAAKPGEYVSQFQSGIHDLSGQIQNRPGFQYDVNADALYQQVAENYLRQGQQAMMDTMGQAAALTGGYGNSYAQTAGQQQYNAHLQELTRLLPQFQQMALEQYRAEGDNLLNRYNVLLQQEEMAYGRYLEEMNRYYDELDRLQSAYDSQRDYDYNRFTDDRDFSYGKYRDDQDYQYQLDKDQAEEARYREQLAYQQERDRIKDEQWQKEYDESVRQYNESMAFQQAKAASRSSGRSGGGSSSGYKQIENQLKEGGMSSADMLKLIRTSSLTDAQQDKLVDKYQKPAQKSEVKAASNKRRNDTSAYWGSR